MKNYDVIIIGGGTAGIFAAYELRRTAPELSVALIEQGNPISKRVCPIIAGKTDHCINCRHCSIMNGFGGAGAFSDGKFNFTTEFGGWLRDYIPDNKVMDLIEYVDSVNVSFGATTERFSTASPQALELEKDALKYDLHLLKAQVKHLGTERNLEILSNIFEDLSRYTDIFCDTTVSELRAAENGGFE
ncbi:MAG: NAD(P)/FAD-dependent oxidoreductase, partial [Clostridia bacterium]|nr:NAD(P)/FAD-dependent oxidoreductase [Clostridia bacterium]